MPESLSKDSVAPTCNCYDRAPTVPVFRDRFTHLADCPCHGMHAMPVGVVTSRVTEPVTITAARSPDEIMRDAHKGIRDNKVTGIVYAHGAVDALYKCGLFTAEQYRLWNLALNICPGHDDEGGRVWCAYCGSLLAERKNDER